MTVKILEPELVWWKDGFRAGHQIEVLEDGTLGRVGPSLGKASERLPGEALLPGMVNAHSHAFQRGLRGKGERFGGGSGTFWSWREEMYRLVGSLDADAFHRLSLLAFREMLSAGITTVGEFHYLHHPGDSASYELDDALVAAAREAGIRLALLDVCYLTGDVGAPLEATQKRFGSESLDAFWASAERLENTLDRRTQSLGLSAHSIRAVPLEAIAALHGRARERGLVFHMHVEEQTREIESAVSFYRKRPLALLLDRLELGPEFTAVHCTHSNGDDLDRLAASGANVGICPLTEANLADGIFPVRLARGDCHLALGTDSNLRVDFTEEMRLLEYAGRLREERRGIFTGRGGSVAERLFEIATTGGARSLGVRAGALEPGYAADYFTIDLNAPALAESSTEELLSAFVFGGDARAIRRVAVGGRRVV